MDKVTYIAHGGFCVTLDDVILAFDYLHDPSHALHKILSNNPGKPVVFFISHNPDCKHFNTSTFEIAQNHKRLYVVSNDVPAKIIPSTLAVQGMSHGDYVEDLPGGISVKAYSTTEKGVSFLVTTKDGKKIFYAGELNDWDLPDETSKKDAQKMYNRYDSIVKYIASECPEMDIVIFPVNPRISLDFARGARIFTDTIKVKDFFPMDIDGDAKDACNFNYLPEGTTGHCMRDPGQSINL